MSEMLANQYFLSGRYRRALPMLETLLPHSRDRALLVRKVLICYLHMDRLDRALGLCLEVLRSSPDDLLDSDVHFQHLPCPAREEWDEEYSVDSADSLNKRALAHLICEPESALDCFRLSLELFPSQSRIEEILNLLEDHRQNGVH